MFLVRWARHYTLFRKLESAWANWNFVAVSCFFTVLIVLQVTSILAGDDETAAEFTLFEEGIMAEDVETTIYPLFEENRNSTGDIGFLDYSPEDATKPIDLEDSLASFYDNETTTARDYNDLPEIQPKLKTELTQEIYSETHQEIHSEIYSKSKTENFAKLESTCTPKSNIFFLKTHKTGSSTVQNLLLRYGDKNNLTFALPRSTTGHVFNYAVKFAPWMVREAKVNPPNILCNHLRYEEDGVRETMPEDTAFISIIRDPVSLFKSTFIYYLHEVKAFKRVADKYLLEKELKAGSNSETVKIKKYNGNSETIKVLYSASNPEPKKNEDFSETDIDGMIAEFLTDPTEYLDSSNASHYEHFVRNALAFDFGLEDDLKNDPQENIRQSSAIKRELESVLKSFDLVLNMNYFDESLVLLQDFLCWDWQDIVYLRQNTRFENEPRGFGEIMKKASGGTDDKLVSKIRIWNSIDVQLYEIANRTFNQRMQDFGEDRMRYGLMRLKREQDRVFEKCIDESVDNFRMSATGIPIKTYIALLKF